MWFCSARQATFNFSKCHQFESSDIIQIFKESLTVLQKDRTSTGLQLSSRSSIGLLSWKCWWNVSACCYDVDNVTWRPINIAMSPTLWLNLWLGHILANVSQHNCSVIFLSHWVIAPIEIMVIFEWKSVLMCILAYTIPLLQLSSKLCHCGMIFCKALLLRNCWHVGWCLATTTCHDVLHGLANRIWQCIGMTFPTYL